ncbi:cytochrome P450 9e2 [Diabrotica virgifera virgifera]|uniref:Cytochrome P450 9e2-like n=1 Tax=Diabrotica virgifera virgifera TaxID=50390 RepID=A0A6P7G8A8_DIAVI|nr:cytochrome P450 9e2 [Diabrotica virgifera virgifera]XP_028141068.1 cytochrome P450 9e2 [Diabrotica virgifera virgifera]XP_028141076.1 cytochrome P450 9e2 [Diabrotica virgifera virgifera]
MLQLILVAVVIGVLFYYYGVKPLSYWKERGVKQTNPWWLCGDNWGVVLQRQSFPDLVLKGYKTAPEARYSGMYQFTLPTLVITDIDLIKQLGVKDFDYFMDHRSFIPEKADPLWGKNLFALTGQRWKEMRPILSPSFTSSKMKSMFMLMSECGEKLVKFFMEKDQNAIEIEMKDTLTRYTNDVIASAAFGVQIDSLNNTENEFYLMGKNATNFRGFWRTMKLFGYMIIPKIFEFFKVTLFDMNVRRFFTELISGTIKIREEKGIIRPDMIHLLMQARKGIHQKEEKVVDAGFAVVQESNLESKVVATEMTDLDICAQALIFFFAGFETVSSTMCFVAHELACNPDVQSRLRDEIRETLDQCNGKVTYEAMLKMKYLDMVISESMRKWPAVIAVDRICTKPYTLEPATLDEKPLHLDKGTIIWFPIYGLHRDPKHYPDPERFDPERFSDENKGNINPYAYLPFGVGPRNCIGSRFALLEMKVLFFHLLANFEIVPGPKTEIPLRICKKQFGLTAENGFWFNLKKLKN